MKKHSSLLLFAMILLQMVQNTPLLAHGPANGPAPSELAKWDCELQSLTELELLVQETQRTHSQLREQGHPLAQIMETDTDVAQVLLNSAAPENERLLGIPGFLWGFCCSFIGMFLVYLSIDDPASKKREGTQAIIGCAAGTILWVGLYIWLVVSFSYY